MVRKSNGFSVSEPGEWMTLDECLVKISFHIASDAPLHTVKLYLGGKLTRCYRPNVKAFEAIDVTNKSQAFYFVADNSIVRITVLELDRKGIDYIIHNPLDRPIKVKVSTSADLRDVITYAKTHTLAPGATLSFYGDEAFSI